MIVSDTLFDSRDGFSGQDIRRRHSRDRVSKVVSLPWQPVLGLKLLLTGFLLTIAPRQLVMEGGLRGRLTECRYCRCHGNHFLAFGGLQLWLYDS